MMTDNRMALIELIEQGAENDLVREMLAFVNWGLKKRCMM